MSSSVDGLVSGLDTSNLITQLMAIEARPQTLMKARQAGYQAEITAYDGIRSLLGTVKAGAQALVGANDWMPITTTSSDPDAATATGTAASATGSVTFTVEQLAAAHTITSAGTATSLSEVVAPSGSVALSVGGDHRSVAVGTGTLQEVVDAINAQPGFAVTATAVQVAPGQFRLQLRADTAGSASAVSVDPAQLGALAPSWLETTPATDARVSVGSGAQAYAITSTSNTLEGVLSGVTITLKRAGATVTVGSARDGGAMADKVQALVTSVNNVLAEVAKQTRYDPATRSGSALTGDSTVRDVQRLLVQAISNPVDDRYPDTYGLTIGRDGKVAFDRDTFLRAFTADPAATQEAFDAGRTTPPATSDGIAARLVGVVNRATTGADGTEGLLATALAGRKATVADLQGQIEAFQLRLDRRQLALKKQYASLETVLGNLSNQSSWLSGQLSNLG